MNNRMNFNNRNNSNRSNFGYANSRRMLGYSYSSNSTNYNSNFSNARRSNNFNNNNYSQGNNNFDLTNSSQQLPYDSNSNNSGNSCFNTFDFNNNENTFNSNSSCNNADNGNIADDNDDFSIVNNMEYDNLDCINMLEDDVHENTRNFSNNHNNSSSCIVNYSNSSNNNYNNSCCNSNNNNSRFDEFDYNPFLFDDEVVDEDISEEEVVLVNDIIESINNDNLNSSNNNDNNSCSNNDDENGIHYSAMPNRFHDNCDSNFGNFIPDFNCSNFEDALICNNLNIFSNEEVEDITSNDILGAINSELAMLSIPNQLLTFVTDGGSQFNYAIRSFLFIYTNNNAHCLVNINQEDLIMAIIDNVTQMKIVYDDSFISMLFNNNNHYIDKLNTFFGNNGMFTIEDDNVVRYGGMSFDICNMSLLMVAAVLIPTNEVWYDLVDNFIELLCLLSNVNISNEATMAEWFMEELLTIPLLSIRVNMADNGEVDDDDVDNGEYKRIITFRLNEIVNNEDVDKGNTLINKLPFFEMLIARYQLKKLSKKRRLANNVMPGTVNPCCSQIATADDTEELQFYDQNSRYESFLAEEAFDNFGCFVESVENIVNEILNNPSIGINSDLLLDLNQQLLVSESDSPFVDEIYIRANVIARLIYFYQRIANCYNDNCN